MGVREIDRFLQQWQMDARDLRRRTILEPTPPGTGEVVCPVAPSSRMDVLGHGGGSGKGPPYHWPVGRRLRRGRAPVLDFRAVRGPPPPALSVKEPPARSGIELANWNWKVVHQFVSGRFGISLSRSSCLNYPRLHEGRLCTAWDLF